MIDTGERYVPSGSFDELDATHTTNYIFAKQFIEGKVVLDVGCGCGYGCEYLARSGAKNVIGVDVSREAVKFAKAHYNAGNLDYIVMDAQNLAFKDRLFDVVVSFEVIEHLYNAKKYLFEVHRVLKTDGIFIISTPNKKVSSPCFKKAVLPFHVKEFYPEELYILLSQIFKAVNILGKRISNEEILMKEQEFRRSWRFKIISRLSQYDFVRMLARLLPLDIKQIVTGAGQLRLKPSDFELSTEYVKHSPCLVAILRK
ncbi:2-polyprenyl-6-hydroxyphenyl methylase / 3-demethylubiquinone-9 3-methyltransferase [Candidatus Hakubella thermalkaliphila]|nr:2-polyprenyl-6-hydroxyphenyl methylase / 3-demethylubiquinone-9 3-methyltransferase [Candidatus Hakubella thermalkaliphila]